MRLLPHRHAWNKNILTTLNREWKNSNLRPIRIIKRTVMCNKYSVPADCFVPNFFLTLMLSNFQAKEWALWKKEIERWHVVTNLKGVLWKCELVWACLACMKDSYPYLETVCVFFRFTNSGSFLSPIFVCAYSSANQINLVLATLFLSKRCRIITHRDRTWSVFFCSFNFFNDFSRNLLKIVLCFSTFLFKLDRSYVLWSF